jgi:hypothetical protein
MSLVAVIGLIFRGERRVRRVLTEVLGDGKRPDVLRRLAAMEASIATLEESVKEMSRQLSPADGCSMHDAVTRVDERTWITSERMSEIDQRLSWHIASPHPKR